MSVSESTNNRSAGVVSSKPMGLSVLRNELLDRYRLKVRRKWEERLLNIFRQQAKNNKVFFKNRWFSANDLSALNGKSLRMNSTVLLDIVLIITLGVVVDILLYIIIFFVISNS